VRVVKTKRCYAVYEILMFCRLLPNKKSGATGHTILGFTAFSNTTRAQAATNIID
jgi:hypothetical protein